MRSSTKRLLLKGAIAYVLLIVGGWAGGHRWFLNRPLSAGLLAGLAIGGALIGSQVSDPVGSVMFYIAFGWIVIDFFRLPAMVVASGPNFFSGKELSYAMSEQAGAPAPAIAPPARTIADAATLDARIDRAAALAGDEATKLALQRFAEARHRLSGQVFASDLAGEVEVIERRHFSELLSEYLEARPYCEDAAGASADRTLRDGVDRLAERLLELSHVQAARDLGELETIEHYLHERHPIARDDPLGSSASGR